MRTVNKMTNQTPTADFGEAHDLPRSRTSFLAGRDCRQAEREDPFRGTGENVSTTLDRGNQTYIMTDCITRPVPRWFEMVVSIRTAAGVSPQVLANRSPVRML